MPQRGWQQVVQDLSDAGYRSVYLERLRARVDLEQAQDDLEQELLQEMASALGRAEAKLNWALLQLELVTAEWQSDAGSSPREVDWLRRAEDHRAACRTWHEAAEQARWELVVHREALGLTRNEIIYRTYPIPPVPAGL